MKKNQKWKLSRSTVIILIGFVLDIVTTVIPFPSVWMRNALIITGLVLIFLGMILARMDNPFSLRRESGVTERIGFDFVARFREYENVMSGKNDSMKYSTWRNNLLREYSCFRESQEKEKKKKKKIITQDIRYYLKETKRRAEDKVDMVKTIMIPAELGIVASFYELDFEPITDEMAFFIVLCLSAVLCLLCSVEIRSGNKIIQFVDDFCEVLEIPI